MTMWVRLAAITLYQRPPIIERCTVSSAEYPGAEDLSGNQYSRVGQSGSPLGS